MTRKKLAEWLNKQGYKTTPEKITTMRYNQQETEAGAHPLFIEFNIDGLSTNLYMSCWLNLHEITQELKNRKDHELKVIRNKWNGFELDLVTKHQ